MSLFFSYVPLLDPFYDLSWWRIIRLMILLALILVCAVLYRSSLVGRYAIAILCSLVILGMSFHIARETGWRRAAAVFDKRSGQTHPL